MGSDVWTGDSSFSSSMLMDWILSVLGSVTALVILRIPGRCGVGLSAGGGGESGTGVSSSHLDMDSTDCMPYALEDVSVTDADGEGESVSVCRPAEQVSGVGVSVGLAVNGVRWGVPAVVPVASSVLASPPDLSCFPPPGSKTLAMMRLKSRLTFSG